MPGNGPSDQSCAPPAAHARRRRAAGRLCAGTAGELLASAIRRTGSSMSKARTVRRNPGASCPYRSSSLSLPLATAAASQECFCGRASKPASKAGPNRIFSAVGAIGTENGARGFAQRPGRWLDVRLELTRASALDTSISTSTAGSARTVRRSMNQCATRLDFGLTFLQGAAAETEIAVVVRAALHLCAGRTEAAAELAFTGSSITSTSTPAPAAVLEFIDRNNVFTPTRGIFAETVYLVSRRYSAPTWTSNASSRW